MVILSEFQYIYHSLWLSMSKI